MTGTSSATGAHGPALPFPDTTLIALILGQAAETPDAIALRQGDIRLTYGELVASAAGVARALRERGAGPEIRVGICSSRTPSLVSLVLGVLLSGGCYVPLEPGGPRERLAEIAADAGVKLVIGDTAAAEFAAAPGIATLGVPGPAPIEECPATAGNTAHVLYTSGSTGRPKGVLTSHRNLVAFVTGFAARLGSGTRTLGISSPAFDAFSMDVFVPLAHGGSVQLAGEADRADPDRLRRFIVEHDVDWGFITPALLSLLDPADVPGWRTIACGGDRVPAELAARWLPGRRFFHVYGPTETTVVVVADEVTGEPAEPLPLGTPTPNHRAHVADAEFRPVSPGEVGELLIGGPGVSGGYLDNADLTARKFVDDPFGGPGERLYRTGDLVRLCLDGRFEFVGRADRQVKVRGQRIEPGEVEAALAAHPDVTAAVVEAMPGPGGTRLVAFLAPATAPSDEDLREHVRHRLTPAMRPTAIRRLSTLPVNPVSGKIDRQALRALAEAPDGGVDFGLSDTPVHRAVAKIWRRVLGEGAAGEFLAAGGNSIAAMRLVAGLRTELAADVTVDDVLGSPAVADLARRVAAAGPLGEPELSTGHRPALSPPQRRLWFLDQLVPDAAPYNIAMAYRLSGELDVDALRAALRAVSERHDVLRWRIHAVEGTPSAECLPPGDVPLPVLELSGTGLDERLAADAATPIHLDREAPWRVRLYRLGETEHVLGFTLHHAVFDGWSQDLLAADLSAAYTGCPLTPTEASYSDYAAWRTARDERREAVDLAWWTERLNDVPTVLELPRDRPRPAVQTYRGASLVRPFPSGATETIRNLAGKLGATAASVLLAGFSLLLSRLTGASDHLVATVVADRQLAAWQDIAGFFVDIVPLRLRADGTEDFGTHVRRCSAELRAATAHPAAPIDRLVDALGVQRNPAHSPLVQVMFNVLDFTEPSLELPGLRAEWLPVAKPGSPFDLTLYVGNAGVELLYNPDLFDRARMEALAEDYVRLVAGLAAGLPVTGLPRASLRVAAPDALRSRPGPVAPVPAADPAARAGTEAVLAAIWREVLGRDSIRVTDNFFDVGGNSLALAKVHAQVTARLGRVPMVDLFTHPNIRALAAHLAGGAEANPELARAAQRVAARRGRTPGELRRVVRRAVPPRGAQNDPPSGNRTRR